LDNLGLGAAVKSYAQDWGRRTGIRVDLDIDPSLGRLPESIELSIFRIIQESLRNVRKHADASSVAVQIWRLSPRMLSISIGDDGRGLARDFDLATLSSERHYGLLGISERVALLGGRLMFRNRKGGGLMIRVEIPHPRTT
jgi:signal transduction histidine kinase